MNEWLYGRNAVYEAIRAGRRKIYRLFVAEGVQTKGKMGDILAMLKRLNIPVETVKRERLEKIHPGNQGVACEVSAYEYADLVDLLIHAAEKKEKPFLLVLDILQDPQNVGSLLRTAEIVGVHGVILPLRETVGITPAVVNASAGASEHILVARQNIAQAIEILKREGVWVAGLEDTPDAIPMEQAKLDGAVALVVGGEGSGIRPLVRRSCDMLIRLPMRGKIQSYNAAIAGSIALYFVARGRGIFEP